MKNADINTKQEGNDLTKEVQDTNLKDNMVATAAKSGKRSSKAISEREEAIAKEERKKSITKDQTKPAKTKKPTRPILERRGKKYKEFAKLIEKNKLYSIDDALGLVCKTSYVNFDATVEMHIRLNVDPKQADQNIRDSVILPSGTGKDLRVAVFAEEDVAKDALKAGASIAGTEQILSDLDKGIINFEVLIAPPNLMAKLAKYARILGPKGLMPNPKSGTVTNEIVKAVKASKSGRIEYRVDSGGIIHVSIGKVSFGNKKLHLNLTEVVESIKQNRPSSIKGAFFKSVAITTTMGPSVMLNISEL